MFFFGILSSIIPYIATIALSCVYILVGQSTTAEVESLVANSDKIITIEQSFNDYSYEQSSTLFYASCFYASSPTNQEARIHSHQKLKIVLLCPNTNYQSPNTGADGNKAPPVLSKSSDSYR